MRRSLPRILITPGDPDGVGPEIVWKTLRNPAFSPKNLGVELVCVGAREPFDEMGANVVEVNEDALLSPLPKNSKPVVYLLPAPLPKKRGLLAPGFQSGWAIEKSVRLIQGGAAHALATGPISKERLQAGGFPYPGHTEFLAKLCGIREVTMMLANEQLRISLVTTHLALKDVPRALTPAKIERAVLDTITHLQKWWGIQKPRIGVAALNPHAGESGIFGKEEIRVIEPTLASLRRKLRQKALISPPLPADTLFAKHVMAKRADRFDAVVCMYHDQGLIPVKLLDFPRTVNVTLGLPIVRTSVDHGVGFDIAGKNKADPSSLQSAIDLAIHISRHKRSQGDRQQNNYRL